MAFAAFATAEAQPQAPKRKSPIALFLLLLVFAVWNTEPVTLRYWFDRAWQAPLVMVLLAFFAAGALFGIAAVLGGSLRQRREIGRLRREAVRILPDIIRDEMLDGDGASITLEVRDESGNRVLVASLVISTQWCD